jgi:hypothetical protein
MDLEDLEGLGVISLLFLIRNCKEREGRGPGGFGSDFLIKFNKEE